MKKHGISWTNETWNPVTGCTKVSEGCKNCYAEKMHKRLNAMGLEKYSEPFNKVAMHADEVDKPLHWKKPRMIFVNSMSDLFHAHTPFNFLSGVFSVMGCLNNVHTFQVLTKRPEKMLEFVKRYYGNAEYINTQYGYHQLTNKIPIENIWLGVTTENQKTADERIPLLLQTPAKVRWLSVEPMLEGIDLTKIVSDSRMYKGKDVDPYYDKLILQERINWVVVGCESGPDRRPCKIEWVESIVEQCKFVGIPVFVKQLNINGKVVKDIELFPEHLRVREYPNE